MVMAWLSNPVLLLSDILICSITSLFNLIVNIRYRVLTYSCAFCLCLLSYLFTHYLYLAYAVSVAYML